MRKTGKDCSSQYTIVDCRDLNLQVTNQFLGSLNCLGCVFDLLLQTFYGFNLHQKNDSAHKNES
jgi:aconitase B